MRNADLELTPLRSGYRRRVATPALALEVQVGQPLPVHQHDLSRALAEEAEDTHTEQDCASLSRSTPVDADRRSLAGMAECHQGALRGPVFK